MKTQEQLRYATVIINGAKNVLTRFALDLRKANYSVGRPNTNVLCIDDVSNEELLHIEDQAVKRGCYIESLRGEHFVEVPVHVKKAEKTPIEAGLWYFAEHLEDSYPFVYVRSKQIQALTDSMGLSPEEVVVLQLELLDGEGSTPRKLEADARKVADFGLRLATEEDFTEWDLPVPAEVHLREKVKEQENEVSAAILQPDTSRLANFRDGV